jgi:uncharacterized protein (DUF2252 family)
MHAKELLKLLALRKLPARPRPLGNHTGRLHLANFGLFASPERQLIFDLNDFDEAYPAPWEWDIKRLAASIWLNGRNRRTRCVILAGDVEGK